MRNWWGRDARSLVGRSSQNHRWGSLAADAESGGQRLVYSSFRQARVSAADSAMVVHVGLILATRRASLQPFGVLLAYTFARRNVHAQVEKAAAATGAYQRTVHESPRLSLPQQCIHRCPRVLPMLLGVRVGNHPQLFQCKLRRSLPCCTPIRLGAPCSGKFHPSRWPGFLWNA